MDKHVKNYLCIQDSIYINSTRDRSLEGVHGPLDYKELLEKHKKAVEDQFESKKRSEDKKGFVEFLKRNKLWPFELDIT